MKTHTKLVWKYAAQFFFSAVAICGAIAAFIWGLVLFLVWAQGQSPAFQRHFAIGIGVGLLLAILVKIAFEYGKDQARMQP